MGHGCQHGAADGLRFNQQGPVYCERDRREHDIQPERTLATHAVETEIPEYVKDSRGSLSFIQYTVSDLPLLGIIVVEMLPD
jgi:hypothetical protein